MTPLFPPETFIPAKVICRKDGLAELPDALKEYGLHGIIVHGSSFEKSGAKAKLEKDILTAGFQIEFFCRPQGLSPQSGASLAAPAAGRGKGADRTGMSDSRRNRTCAQRSSAVPVGLSASEATLNEISAVIEKGKGIKAGWIVGIGGGSVLDLAKAAAGLFNASEKPVYYQEGGALKEKGIPFIAIPTTAGSGSEATLNAVIINPEKKLKLSIRDKSFLPKKVILDPELLKGLPRQVICHSGMDALVQAYESFISKNATVFSETLALRAIEMITSHLIPAAEKLEEKDLHVMLVGSFFSGLAFSHSRLGVIHGIAHPLGVFYDIPHGLVCSVCFVPSIRVNQEAMGEKYNHLSRAVGKDFEKKISELLQTLGIRSPFKGKSVIEKEKIITETLKSGSTASNPKRITREDVEFILKEIF